MEINIVNLGTSSVGYNSYFIKNEKSSRFDIIEKQIEEIATTKNYSKSTHFLCFGQEFILNTALKMEISQQESRKFGYVLSISLNTEIFQ